MHLNEYLGSLADLWPSMREMANTEKISLTAAATATTAAATATATGETATRLAKPLGLQSLSLRDGLLGAGVGKEMMGIADAGYANTVGAALDDTSLMGTCFLEHEWDIDGDRTFVLKVGNRWLPTEARELSRRCRATTASASFLIAALGMSTAYHAEICPRSPNLDINVVCVVESHTCGSTVVVAL